MQDDEIEKSINLSTMDSIYKTSSVIIVAAAGNGADAGLPRVRHRSRVINQIAEAIEDMTFMAPQPPLESFLENYP